MKGSAGGACDGSVVNGGRSIRLDFGAQHWYTRANRANVKPFILLILLKRCGNPFFSAKLREAQQNQPRLFSLGSLPCDRYKYGGSSRERVGDG